MIGIVDYEAGNMTSVSNALTTIDAKFIISDDSETLAGCDGIILPGVGAAPGAMASLERRGLTTVLSQFTKPFLGICLGMQLLYELSEEGMTYCLNVLPGTIKKFDNRMTKIPHMGWNNIKRSVENPLMANIESDEYFYFANSFYAEINENTIATTEERIPFAAAIMKKNYYGVQFHPEKSGKAGLTLLHNFEKLCSSSRQ